MFFCACISKAFTCNDIKEIIECGLSFIPVDSTYYKVSRAVIDFYNNDKDKKFRECYEMLRADWGYDKYGGICHIIPNAGVCILAMLYGEGDLGKSIEIATMCGWDTDCNAGNIGTVIGVMVGIDGLPKRYREPINDSIVLSGVSGYLNILDIPSYAKEVALLGYRLAKEESPKELFESFKEGEVYFDFNLKGSTHNFRSSNPSVCKIEHSDKFFEKGKGSLKILIKKMENGDSCKVYYKPFYTREDFSDERYKPVFSPTAYSGQKVSIRVYLEVLNDEEIEGVLPYVATTSKKEYVQGFEKFQHEKWTTIEFIIPDTDGEMVTEVGFIAESCSNTNVYIDEFSINGDAKYYIDISKQFENFKQITPFSFNHGFWDIEDGKLSLMHHESSYSFTGNYFARNYKISSTITPLVGSTHFLNIRSQGVMRGYILGFDKDNSVAIYKNDFGLQLLKKG